MDIKATKKILVSGNAHPVKVGEVVKGVEDSEAKALVAMGYAVEVKGKGNAPENKSADPDSNPFAAVLAGSVADITARLDTFSAAELRTLRDLEAAGKNRQGVADAINAYDLGE